MNYDEKGSVERAYKAAQAIAQPSAFVGGLGHYATAPISTVSERDTVGAALDRQYEALLGLHGAINQLEERLQTLLEPAKADGSADGPAPDSKQLLHRVCRATHVADSATCRIERLMARLQV